MKRGGLFMERRIRIADLKYKEVINVYDGARLGYISDVEFSLQDGKIYNLIVPGPLRFFGIFGRGEDYVISWESISKIGDDIVLVDYETQRSVKKKENRLFY